jgi:thiosulfate reductase cytochrome b subunit
MIRIAFFLIVIEKTIQEKVPLGSARKQHPGTCMGIFMTLAIVFLFQYLFSGHFFVFFVSWFSGSLFRFPRPTHRLKPLPIHRLWV